MDDTLTPIPPSFALETVNVSLEEEMRRSYLDYAMSVIVGRALPDARDGLKPVHRRVLYAMHEMSNDYNKAYKKSARIVGDVIGKYHPHGDTAVYDTIVRMAQDFSMRYVLVDGQGNFGSVDGDSPAAMRYTEIRMSKIAHELLQDIDKNTVDFVPNYDGSEHEPRVLPTRLPNLLINGSSGIAVGMATNIPPHNLTEVINGCLAVLDNPQIDIEELINIIPAPDFPTSGQIYGLDGVRDGYRTGRGRVLMRSRTHFENLSGNRQAIVVDELPYQVNKARLLEHIGDMVREKKIEGITHLQDESDKSGMRMVIELRRGEVPEVVLNNLFKHTQLQESFSMNMVALVDNQPRLLNLKQFIEIFLLHRREVVVRRTRFELTKAKERAHLLEGLAVALSNVDEVIELIKTSATPAEAKAALILKPWRSVLVTDLLAGFDVAAFRPEGLSAEYGLSAEGYRLSPTQAQAILDLRLQRLTGLEQDKIQQEYQEILGKIKDLLDILSNPERVRQIIISELTSIRDSYGDKRKSEIVQSAGHISIEDLIAREDMVVTLSHTGYVKAQPISEYRVQNRGGRGKAATRTKEEDYVDQVVVAHSHDKVLCFSNLGRVYWLKTYEIPQGGRGSRGKPIVNLLPLVGDERINSILPVKNFDDSRQVLFATKHGVVKKTPLVDYSRPRSGGIMAIGLDEGDHLIGTALVAEGDDVMLFSNQGKAVRFQAQDVRSVGRGARGVRGMRLKEGEAEVVSMLIAQNEDLEVLTATENGYGKRTPVSDYPRHGRGGQGVIAITTSKRNGKVVGAALVEPSDEVLLVTTGGVLIRIEVGGIRQTSRNAQGVTLIRLDAGEALTGLQRVMDQDFAEPEAEEGVEQPTLPLD